MSKLTAIDADGHVIEKESEIRKHLKAPWNMRTTPLRPGDQPWITTCSAVLSPR